SVIVSMMASLFFKRRETGDMIVSLFIHEYPTLMLLCMTLVYFGFDRSLGLTAACLAYAAPEFADAVASFVGTFLGRHKLCPAISPKKTVEGSIGALLGGVAFGAILIPLQRLWGGVVSVPALLLIGLGCGVFSQIGDLFASLLKRWAGIKDFSSIFPGHGGVMDRIDSLLFCSALVLGCFTILTKLGIY
ncbi:MAG: phosphatidate cytidylyltransferase, partial [Clostridia bacterium]|nr:phosphatidate cytidylyltransferase [Clostridia bacterium]